MSVILLKTMSNKVAAKGGLGRRTEKQKLRESRIPRDAVMRLGLGRRAALGYFVAACLLIAAKSVDGDGLGKESRYFAPSYLPVRQSDVLTVGDGNFGFSVALRARLEREGQKSDGHYHLTATSFDSREDISRKYQDALHLLARLEGNCNVTVAHGIDATDLLATLRANRCKECFDCVIFNFPHIGTEDFLLHQSLLAHFFDSAITVLRRGGQVQVALANDQPSRWAVIDVAAQAGLLLLEARSFHPENEFPGYEALSVCGLKHMRP
jgi:hypothetical protein